MKTRLGIGESESERYVYKGDQLVDIETGEIVNLKEIQASKKKKIQDDFATLQADSTLTGIPLNLRLITIKGRDYGCIPIKKNYQFNKIFQTELKDIFDATNLDIGSLGFLTRFTPYIYFPENYLLIDGKIPTLETLWTKLNIKKRKLILILKELEFYDFIKRVKVGRNNIIYINPFLYCSGGSVSIETFKLFKESLFNPYQ